LLCGYAIVWVAQRGLAVTDAISQLVQSQVEPNLQKNFLDAITLGITSAVRAGPLGAVLSLLVIVGGLLIWLELALRSAAIELAVFFMPWPCPASSGRPPPTGPSAWPRCSGPYCWPSR